MRAQYCQPGEPSRSQHYATDAFLRWLYTTAHDQRPTDPTAFLTTAESHFAGDELSGTELHNALARLIHSGLYGVEPEEQAELIRDAEVLAEEASSETAQPGRIRAAFDTVMGGLT
ncbi:hypothetical protein ACGFY3_48590 [Streptomyces mirabilis]|uniref:hypothetical protein n=1 Tax=Streptomyces mirabilis TaxID=68239 RepID=UPI0037194C60